MASLSMRRCVEEEVHIRGGGASSLHFRQIAKMFTQHLFLLTGLITVANITMGMGMGVVVFHASSILPFTLSERPTCNDPERDHENE